jgi:hypothetical protein
LLVTGKWEAGVMESAIVDAVKSLSPLSILLIAVIIALWRELQKEREARITAGNQAIELGFTVRVAMDRLTEVVGKLVEKEKG